ncbi:MAG: GntR family transcriptional regulator [Deltaproteobacteria bacterium]|nr:GntR family transcriptional regulator [Deltaproteobacteria bacterium]
MKGFTNKEVIPLYSRIASILRNNILAGKYAPGSKLLSEEGLSAHFGVSRITIRQSLSRLEREGLIRRSRGKGTFVAEMIPKKRQSIYTSLLDIVNNVQSSEIKPLGIRKVKVGQTRIADELRTFFGLSNEDLIAQIHRIPMGEDTPFQLFENFMPLELASHITLEDIVEKKAIIRILQDKIGLKIGKGEMYLEAISADPEMAEILGCQIYDSFIRAQVFFWLANGDPFEIVHYFMQAEHFKYKIDIDMKDFDSDTSG